MASQELLDAIDCVAWTVSCLDCNGTVEVVYEPLLDCPVIRHRVRHPLGRAGVALAEHVQSELARFVWIGDYNERLPVHGMAGK